jgi:predicted RNase H-like HicB family nuclease
MIDPEETTMEQLALHVDVHHEEDSCWAEVRELPGCFAAGDTVAELIESIEEAVALYLAPPEAGETHRSRSSWPASTLRSTRTTRCKPRRRG